MDKARSRKKRRKPGAPDPAPARRSGRWGALDRGGWWVAVALALIYAVGFQARAEDYPRWKDNRAAFFHEGEPILANGDGYYYLRYARDLAEGNWNAADTKRRYPDEPPRPSPPPLLSVVTAALHQALPFSLDRIAVFLPVLLAPLLILPVYGLARVTGGGAVMGLCAALLVVVSEYYVGRTRIGVYDTDCLIVTLTAGLCWCIYRFAVDASRSRYLYAAAALLGYIAFYLWWDTATMAVSTITLCMAAIALVFFYRPGRREGLVFAAVAVAVGAVLWRLGLDSPRPLDPGVTGMLALVGGEDAAGPFPSTVVNIRELQVLPFAQMAQLTAGHAVFFVAGAVGVVWWLLRLGRRAALVAVPVLIACFPPVFGNRFIIFMAPVVALGLGFLIERAWVTARGRGPLTALIPLVVLAPAGVCYSQATARFYQSPMARSMDAIAAVAGGTPESAVVWSSYWNGYPVMYYARRATITDAGTLEGPRLVYQNIPLAAGDPRLSANFMQFWIARGSDGMRLLTAAAGDDPGAALKLLKAVCAAGPEKARAIVDDAVARGGLSTSGPVASTGDWLQFFFPPRTVPMFLLLTQDLVESMVWFERGTWDPSARAGVDATYSPFYGVRRTGDAIEGGRGLHLDLRSGALRAREPDGSPTALRVSRVVTVTAEGLDVDDLGGTSGMGFEWIPNRRFGAVMSQPVAESTFNRLFVRFRPDGRYFRPVSLETPSFQLWEVRGDAL